MAKGTSLLCVLGEILAQRVEWSPSGCALPQSQESALHLECVLVLLVQDEEKFIFFSLAYLLANTYRSCSGKLSDPEAPRAFDPTLLSVGVPMMELWRILAGLLSPSLASECDFPACVLFNVCLYLPAVLD